MPLISKPNYNQIFASQAPEQDKPAVFNNYPSGWGVESRPNNGKPTIKGFNYLQQTSDLKDLWILQNGACLPYDESIEYAEGAPVLKDGVIQYKVGGGFKSRDSVSIPTYSNAADGVDPVIGVANGAYFNVRSSSDESYIDEYQNIGGSGVPTGKSYLSALGVQQQEKPASTIKDASGVTQQDINDLTGAPYRVRLGGYSIGERVVLENGDIVKNTVPGNTVNPNTDMTGWFFDSSTITPFHFGAVGDGISHKLSGRYSTLAEAKAVYPHAVSLDDEIDWCAIQAMFNFVISRNDLKERIDWSGNFYTNRTLKYVTPKTTVGGQYRTLYGDIIITPSAGFIGNELILLHGRGVNQRGVIFSNIQRRVKFGVTLSASGYDPDAIEHISFGNQVDRLFIYGASVHAVRVRGSGMFAGVNFIRAQTCGVGGDPYAGATRVYASISSHTHENAGQLNSQSTIAVDVLPEADVSEATILVQYNGWVSRVTSIDRNNNQIICRPLLPFAEAGVQLDYIYGGALRTQGSNSAGFQVAQVSQIGCGMLIDHVAMYPPLILSAVSEYAGCVVYNQGLEAGPDIKQKYLEGDRYIAVSNNEYTIEGSVNLEWGLNVDPAKLVNLTYGRKADGSTMDYFGGFQGLRLMNNNIQHQWKFGKLPRNIIPNGVSNGFGVDFNAPHENKIYKVPNNVTVGFMPIDENWNRLFGYDSQELTIVGNGANSAPTGTITIPVLSGYTLNGGTTSLTYSGFNAAAHFKFFLNVAAKDIQVSVSGVNVYNLSVGAILANGSDVNDLAANTKFWFRAATTATNLPTPTTGTKVDGNISTLYSVAALGSAHNKTQVVEYVSLYEKWERVFSSATGLYGAWRLLSYETKRGTTAQRPSNPQLGMRYYDTTLLAAGKPIEWNGSNWVDMAGATV